MKKVMELMDIEDEIRTHIHEKVLIKNFDEANRILCLIIEKLDQIKVLEHIEK